MYQLFPYWNQNPVEFLLRRTFRTLKQLCVFLVVLRFYSFVIKLLHHLNLVAQITVSSNVIFSNI